MPVAIATQFMDQIAQSCVVDHQHPACPGIGAGSEGDNRAKSVTAQQHLLALAKDLFFRVRLRMRRHRRLQHAQARALFLALDQEPCAERAHAAFASLDNERSRIAVSGFDEDFAFLQNNQALLFIETHIHGAVGIEVEQRAVGQPHSALFAGGGTLVGEPVIERQIAFTGKQGQTHHRDNTGQTTPQFAYAAANAFA